MKKRNRAVDLTFDAAFKMYFKREPDLLKSLLQNFLPLPKDSLIADVLLLDNELTREDPDKTFVLDMKVKIDRRIGEETFTETVNVEMQSTSQPHLADRLLAYSARIYSDQLQVGQSYDELATVYSLAFTPHLYEFRGDQEHYYHVCTLRSEQSPDLVCGQGIKLIVVELDKFLHSIDKIVDLQEAWCYILKRCHKMDEREFEILAKKGETMTKAVKSLWNLSEDDLARERLEAIEKQERDQRFYRNYALKQGFKEGMQKGIEEGREEGREKKQKEIALNLLQKGIDIAIIIESTGLSEEEIQALKVE